MNRFSTQQCLKLGFIRYPLGIEKYRPGSITSIAKRTFDVVFSILILTTLIWLLAIIALIIKLTSKGPVIFRQIRVGQGEKLFTMYKFRSLEINSGPDTENYKPLALSDQKITKFGRFLRKSCLDELPQFVNVLLGDMSIVGPRPEMEFVVRKYNAIEKRRLLIKPGITGIWQLEADRSRLIHEDVDYDLFYIENISLSYDMEIMFRTILYILKRSL